MKVIRKMWKIRDTIADLKDQVDYWKTKYEKLRRDSRIELENEEKRYRKQIETIKNNIQRVRTRLRQRQISTEAHNKLMIEYNKIKERAENRIEEILLRFREDINI